MRKLVYIVALMALVAITACNKKNDDEKFIDTWNKYADWRVDNENWINGQIDRLDEDGNRYYERLYAPWAPTHYVLVHWINDRTETEGNLTPLYTSTVSTKYVVRLYDDEKVDSSYSKPGGIMTSQLSNLIEGWQIAMMDMHVGDTVEVLTPYNVAYGSKSVGQIPPFSALRFNIRLEDVPTYEVRP